MFLKFLCDDAFKDFQLIEWFTLLTFFQSPPALLTIFPSARWHAQFKILSRVLDTSFTKSTNGLLSLVILLATVAFDSGENFLVNSDTAFTLL